MRQRPRCPSGPSGRTILHFRFFSLLLVAGALSCQSRPTPLPISKGTKLFCWKVTSATCEAYLLGTVLLGPKERTPIAPEIESAFERSRFVMVQYDDEKTDLSRLKQFVLERGMYPADDRLSNHLSAKTDQAMLAIVEEQGLSLRTVEMMRPWVLSGNLKVQAIKELDYIPRRSLDRHFKEAARGRKTLVELEGAEVQNKLLADLPEEMQEQLLAATLEDVKEMKAYLELSAEYWVKGDAARMEQLRIRGPLEKHPERRGLQAQVVDARNLAMAKKIAGQLTDEGGVFIILSVDHLLGENGILRLLEKDGRNVEQMEAQ